MKKVGLFVLVALVAIVSQAQEFTFTNGIIFINEDRYGANQGSINYYNYDYNVLCRRL